MIEKIVLDYLGDALNLPAFMEQPTNPPGEYLLIEKVGGAEENRIDSAMIAIQSYADSLYRAAEINLAVKEAMRGIAALDSVSRAKLNSDYNFTDTRRKKYRYQAIYGIVYYD